MSRRIRSLPTALAVLALLVAACGNQDESTDDPTCTDGIQNGDETGVDCGGLDCDPCVVEPTCTDEEKNGDETDVDCGGPDCDPCAVGKACAAATDCASGLCEGEVCVAAPTCTDDVMNGEETDIDCGGPSCDPCADGKHCAAGSDCSSGLCVAETCVAAPTCEDETLNGDETDVDCGGPDCDPCANGKGCDGGTDCASGVCSLGFCIAAPTCQDEIKNGQETDVDCGGPDCLPCPDDRLCRVDTDCVNGSCIGGLCDPGNTCENGVKDGNETDVDCGGDCGPCPDGFECVEASDCEPVFIGFACDGGVCGGMWTCADFEVSGRETDVDCGGGICRQCGGGKNCNVGEDCLTGVCEEGVCTHPEVYTCENGDHDGYETDIDCGSEACAPCQDGYYCDFDLDCEWEYCLDNVCGGLDWPCMDDELNGHETDLDCGGPICGPCETGKICLEDRDCVSQSCVAGTCT